MTELRRSRGLHHWLLARLTAPRTAFASCLPYAFHTAQNIVSFTEAGPYYCVLLGANCRRGLSLLFCAGYDSPTGCAVEANCTCTQISQDNSLVLATAVVCVRCAGGERGPIAAINPDSPGRVQACPWPALREAELFRRCLSCQLPTCCCAVWCVPVFMLRAAIAKNSVKGGESRTNNKLTQAH